MATRQTAESFYELLYLPYSCTLMANADLGRDENTGLRTVLESDIIELFLYQEHRKVCLILQCESRNSSLLFHMHYKRLHVLQTCD